MPEKLFYIQHTGCFVGNCILFWGPDRGGYTCDLDQAGKYPLEEARRIVSTRKPSEEVAWPVEYIDGFAHRHVTWISQCADGSPVVPGTVVGED
jgi:hypothetical protein